MTKRVLHILNDLRPSGAEVMLHSAARHWAECNVEAEILSTGTQEGTYAETLRQAGYSVWHIPYSSRVSFVRQLASLIRRRHFDVIHVHSERASFIACSIARCFFAIRCVRTVHATFRFTGLVRLKLTLQRKLLTMMGVIHTAIGEGVARNELATYSNHTMVVHNWYDDSRFFPPSPGDRTRRRHALGLAESAFVLATLGNCSPNKNHVALLRAIASLISSDARYATMIQYLHLGEEEANRAEQRLVVELGIEKNVIFFGRAENPEHYLQAIDLFVMPSLCEGFGNAALEAIAMGIPVLLSDVPGLVDFKQSFSTIAYCQPTPESLATALVPLLYRRQNSLAEQHSNVALEKFGVAAGTSAYARLYQSDYR